MHKRALPHSKGNRTVGMQAIHLQESANNAKSSILKDDVKGAIFKDLKIMSKVSHIHLGHGENTITPKSVHY